LFAHNFFGEKDPTSLVCVNKIKRIQRIGRGRTVKEDTTTMECPFSC